MLSTVSLKMLSGLDRSNSLTMLSSPASFRNALIIWGWKEKENYDHQTFITLLTHIQMQTHIIEKELKKLR